MLELVNIGEATLSLEVGDAGGFHRRSVCLKDLISVQTEDDLVILIRLFRQDICHKIRDKLAARTGIQMASVLHHFILLSIGGLIPWEGVLGHAVGTVYTNYFGLLPSHVATCPAPHFSRIYLSVDDPPRTMTKD